MRLKGQGRWRTRLFASFMAQLSTRSRRALEQGMAAQPGFQWCSYNHQVFESGLRHLTSAHVPEIFIMRKAAQEQSGAGGWR